MVDTKKITTIYSRDSKCDAQEKLRRIAEENPDLSYDTIKGILLGLEDMKMGNVEEFSLDMLQPETADMS